MMLDLYLLFGSIVLVDKIHTGMSLNLNIERFESCNSTPGTIRLTVRLNKQKSDLYFANFDFTTPVPLDENVGGVTHFLQEFTQNNFVELLVFREKDFCRTANTYYGEVWYNMERATRVVKPGACPIPRGRYVGRNVTIDLSKVPLKVPFGRLRLIMKLVDSSRHDSTLLCMVLQAQSTKD